MPVISDGRDTLGKHRRELSCVTASSFALAAAFAALASGASAQDWPSRPMTMVVPFAAGGPMDTLARILQPTLGETLGQQIIIENVPGGGGMTGSLRVSQAVGRQPHVRARLDRHPRDRLFDALEAAVPSGQRLPAGQPSSPTRR